MEKMEAEKHLEAKCLKHSLCSNIHDNRNSEKEALGKGGRDGWRSNLFQQGGSLPVKDAAKICPEEVRPGIPAS